MVGTNNSTKENHKFYNSMVQAIQREEGDCVTNVVSLCDCFVDMGAPLKTQVGNWLSKILGFQGQNIDVSDQAVFTLKDPSFHDKE